MKINKYFILVAGSGINRKGDFISLYFILLPGTGPITRILIFCRVIVFHFFCYFRSPTVGD